MRRPKADMFGTARGRDIGQERSSGGSNGPLGSREYCFSRKACPIPMRNSVRSGAGWSGVRYRSCRNEWQLSGSPTVYYAIILVRFLNEECTATRCDSIV